MSLDISCQLTDNLTEIKTLFYRKNYISKADDSHEMMKCQALIGM